jgi:hypothetical protein
MIAIPQLPRLLMHGRAGGSALNPVPRRVTFANAGAYGDYFV